MKGPRPPHHWRCVCGAHIHRRNPTCARCGGKLRSVHEMLEEVRTARARGVALGTLYDHYGPADVVEALGVMEVANILGIPISSVWDVEDDGDG